MFFLPVPSQRAISATNSDPEKSFRENLVFTLSIGNSTPHATNCRKGLDEAGLNDVKVAGWRGATPAGFDPWIRDLEKKRHFQFEDG